MRTLTATLCASILALFCCHAEAFAQLEDLGVCGHDEEEGGQMMMKAGDRPIRPSFIDPNPTGKDFKVAVLYFKAADDNFDASGYPDPWPCRVAQWPTTAAAPDWQGELLITTPYNASTVDDDIAAKANSITAYFYHISNGNLWVYGDEVAYTGPSINFATSEAQWRTNNGDIHQWFIDNYDLTSLDNDGNGEVDMIIFVNRARSGFGFQGIAADYLPSGTISGDPTEPVIRGSGSVVSNSGVYQKDVYDLGARYIIFHEMGHQLLQLYGHYNGLHRWNLMSGASCADPPPTSSGLVMSAWEKQKLGWMTFTEITDDRFGYELPDVTASQQAVKIPVGGNNYFLLEHRKNNTYYEITPDSECGDTEGLAEGLLISYSQNNAQPEIRPADGGVAVVGQRSCFSFDIDLKDGDETDLFPYGSITEITPYTTPNTDDHQNNRTGIAITNIHYDGDNMVFNIFQNYHTGAWSGNVTTNTAWGGTVTINSDVTVQSGATLYIDAGATISFASGSVDLWIEGQIIAKGTAGNPITFTAQSGSPSRSEWGTIFVESDDNTFEYCIVEYSDWGLKIKDASYLTGNVVKNCTFRDNDQGLPRWILLT